MDMPHASSSSSWPGSNRGVSDSSPAAWITTTSSRIWGNLLRIRSSERTVRIRDGKPMIPIRIRSLDDTSSAARLGRHLKIVYKSAIACVGCSSMPLPALMIGIRRVELMA